MAKNQSRKQKQYCNKFIKDFKNGPHQKRKNNIFKKIKDEMETITGDKKLGRGGEPGIAWDNHDECTWKSCRDVQTHWSVLLILSNDVLCDLSFS